MATPAKRALDFEEKREVAATDVIKKSSVSSDVINEVEVTPSDEKENVAQNHDDTVVIVDVKTELSTQPVEKSSKENVEDKVLNDIIVLAESNVSSNKIPEQKKTYREKVVNGNTSPKTTSPKTSKTVSSTTPSSTTSTTTSSTSNKSIVSKEPTLNGSQTSASKTTTALKTTVRYVNQLN